MKVVKHTRYHAQGHEYLWKKGDVEAIGLISMTPCCEEMKQASDDGVVGFGERDSLLNRDANVNIYRCYPYPEGAVWDAYPIRFCPFCAAPIVIEERDAS